MKNIFSFLALSALLIGSICFGLQRQENLRRSLRVDLENPKQSEMTRDVEDLEIDYVRLEAKARAAEEYQEALTQTKETALKYAAENGVHIEEGLIIERGELIKEELSPRIKTAAKEEVIQNKLLAQYNRLKTESP